MILNFPDFYWNIFCITLPLSLFCVVAREMNERCLDKYRANYFNDLVLISAWIMGALYFGNKNVRFIIGISIIGAVFGMIQKIYPKESWKFIYVLIGFVFSCFGPRIEFIGSPNDYYYFTPEVSFFVTALWIAAFPIVLRDMDEIPGMSGRLLSVVFALMLVSTIFSEQNLEESFFLSFTGLTFLIIFWKRHGNMYGRMGESLSAMWGILAAGASIIGVNKGIAFGSLMILPLGLFAVPFVETSLNAICSTFTDKPDSRTGESSFIYSKMLGMGLDHPDAVRFTVSSCSIIGFFIIAFQTPNFYLSIVFITISMIFFYSGIYPALSEIRKNLFEKNNEIKISGKNIHCMSVDYSVSKTIAAIRNSLSGKSENDEKQRIIRPVARMNLIDFTTNFVKKRQGFSIFDYNPIVFIEGFILRTFLKYFKGLNMEKNAIDRYSVNVLRTVQPTECVVYLIGRRNKRIVEIKKILNRKFPELEIIVGLQRELFLRKCEKIKIMLIIDDKEKQTIWLRDNIDIIEKNVLIICPSNCFEKYLKTSI